jgi:hypothetical protein
VNAEEASAQYTSNNFNGLLSVYGRSHVASTRMNDWTLTDVAPVRTSCSMGAVFAGTNLRAAISETRLRELYVSQMLTIEQVARRFDLAASRHTHGAPARATGDRVIV